MVDVNLPVWGYYPSDNQKFIDPLYLPYQNQMIPTPSGVCPVNCFKHDDCEGVGFHPELVRAGWCWDFQRMHPDKDPCPPGFVEGKEGMCHKEKLDWEGSFYTDEQFAPKYQYWNGYAVKPSCSPLLDEFDQKSVNPYTGQYVNYFPSNPSKSRQKYKNIPSMDSYLA